jgi:hypothetical protein
MFLICANRSSGLGTGRRSRSISNKDWISPGLFVTCAALAGFSRRQIHMESAHTGAAAGDPHGPSFPEA